MEHWWEFAILVSIAGVIGGVFDFESLFGGRGIIGYIIIGFFPVLIIQLSKVKKIEKIDAEDVGMFVLALLLNTLIVGCFGWLVGFFVNNALRGG